MLFFNGIWEGCFIFVYFDGGKFFLINVKVYIFFNSNLGFILGMVCNWLRLVSLIIFLYLKDYYYENELGLF